MEAVLILFIAAGAASVASLVRTLMHRKTVRIELLAFKTGLPAPDSDDRDPEQRSSSPEVVLRG